jgi:outer membrane protein with beta-barrel domain
MTHRLLRVALLALGFASLPAFGQFLSVGIKAGVPLNDVFVNSGSGDLIGNTNRFIIGPEAEVRLPFHLGIEVDALYRHYSLGGNSTNEWDFPVLLKYRFKGVPLVRPYVEAGPIFNHVSDIIHVTSNSSTGGFAIGAGVDIHPVLIHITPEIRYVHWGSENYNFAALGSALASNQNQTLFLVGLTF